MKQLYQIIPTNELKNQSLISSIEKKRLTLDKLKAGDSVFTVYITANLTEEYFSKICTGHFFYTPNTNGLSTLPTDIIDKLISNSYNDIPENELKKQVIEYLKEFCAINTYEISIPILRDSNMAPQGKAGIIVSLLFDYSLALKIEKMGWAKEIKELLEKQFIETLDSSVFPGLKNAVTDYFSSSPLTIEKLTGNTQGGITGWAFTNPSIPVESRMLQIAKSVTTPIPNIYQAGQWVYSPSGMPISILTGKLASDKILTL